MGEGTRLLKATACKASVGYAVGSGKRDWKIEWGWITSGLEHLTVECKLHFVRADVTWLGRGHCGGKGSDEGQDEAVWGRWAELGCRQ